MGDRIDQQGASSARAASGAAPEDRPGLNEDFGARTHATRPPLRRRIAARDNHDRDLVARAVSAGKRGDPEAIRYLYSQFADDVYGYICSIVRDEHEAEDITQNVFIKLMTILPKYEERAVPFSAWMLRVARNVALDHLRQRRAIPCEEVRDPNAQTSDGQLERGWSLRDALSTLSADQRQVVLWRHLLGLSPVEIAERLGKTEGSIHALHHRGRRAVKTELLQMQSGPSARRPGTRRALAAA